MKKIIFVILISLLLCGGIVYATNLYKSEDISYTTSDGTKTNVNEALNSLYNMKQELNNIKSLGDATANDILLGKTAVVNGELITGTNAIENKTEVKTTSVGFDCEDGTTVCTRTLTDTVSFENNIKSVYVSGLNVTCGRSYKLNSLTINENIVTISSTMSQNEGNWCYVSLTLTGLY